MALARFVVRDAVAQPVSGAAWEIEYFGPDRTRPALYADGGLVERIAGATGADGLIEVDLPPRSQVNPPGSLCRLQVRWTYGLRELWFWVPDTSPFDVTSYLADPQPPGGYVVRLPGGVVRYDATQVAKGGRGVYGLIKDGEPHPWPGGNTLDISLPVSRPLPGTDPAMWYGNPFSPPLDLQAYDVVECGFSIGLDVTYDYALGPPPWRWPDGTGYGVGLYVGFVVINPSGDPVRPWSCNLYGSSLYWGPDGPIPEEVRWFGQPTDTVLQGRHIRGVLEDEVFDGTLTLRLYYIARPDDVIAPTVDLAFHAFSGDPAVAWGQVWGPTSWRVPGGATW